MTAHAVRRIGSGVVVAVSLFLAIGGGDANAAPRPTAAPTVTQITAAAQHCVANMGRVRVTPGYGHSGHIDYKRIRMTPQSGAVISWTDFGSSSTSHRNVSPGTYTVDYQVRDDDTYNWTGWSPTASITVVAARAPGAPGAPTLTPGDQQIAVSWDAAANYCAITDYDVQYRVGASGAFTSHTHTGTDKTATISDLTNGTSYEVQARAVNALGTSVWSGSSSTTPHTVPSATAAPTLVAGSRQIVVSWEPPLNGGSDITDYDVQHRVGASGAFTSHPHTGTGRTATIGGLTNDTSYQVQVRAVNAAGQGAWSLSSSSTPVALLVPTAPSAPAAPTLTAGDGQIEASWVAPANGGAVITGYNVRYRSMLGAQWSSPSTTTATTTTTTISGLQPGQAYDVQVQAVNGVGPGPWSPISVETPLTPGMIASLNLPLVALLRTPVALELEYATSSLPTDIVLVTSDGVFSLSPNCDQGSASFSPPPSTVRMYPCAAGTGSVTVSYSQDAVTWVRLSEVLAPRYSYTVTVTSQASTTLAEPTVLWRSLSWPLYRDGLIDEGTVVVADGDGGRLRPLQYQEAGAGVDAVDVIVCSLDDPSCSDTTWINSPVATTTTTTLWSSPEPRIGDRVYFLSAVPFALLHVTMHEEGRRETPWVLDWAYFTATGWEPLPRTHDSTEGLRTSGTVIWDQITTRPMAPQVLTTLDDAQYVVRATVANAGAGTYTQPVFSTVAAQSGMWSAALQGDLAPGAATALQVYVLPVDTVAVGDFRRAGPPQALLISPPDITTEAGPWRPWSAPDAPTQPGAAGAAVRVPQGLARPIDSEGELPLIGFAVNRASRSAGVPTLLLWTMIGSAAAFAALVATQRATGNIMISVIAGGLVLGLLTTPSIGLSSVWVLLVYGLIGGTVVIIGRRLAV